MRNNKNSKVFQNLALFVWIVIFVLIIVISLFGGIFKLKLLSDIWTEIPSWLKFIIIFK